MNSQIQELISKVVTKMNDKNPYYLIGGLLFVFVIIPSILVMILQVKNLMSLSSEISNLSLELDSARSDILRSPQYQKEIRTLAEKLETVKKKVKTKEEFPVVLENISRIANKYGVLIEQIMPDSSMDEPVLENDDGKYYSMPIIIEAESGYHHFGRFINHLEVEGLFNNITDFTIAAIDGGTQQQRIKFTVNTVVLEGSQ